MSDKNPKKKPRVTRQERMVATLVRLYQDQTALSALKRRTPLEAKHQRGAMALGVKAVRASIPSAIVSSPAMSPMTWWSEDDVKKADIEAALADAADSDNTGDGPVARVSEERLPLTLLNGEEITVVRRVLFNRVTRRRFKEYLAENASGEVFDYNKVMRDLIPLYGIGKIPADTETVTIVESTGPADVLNDRGVPTVGTLTGAFVAPSVSALQPLLEKKTIFLWPDNDVVGARHMNLIAARLNKMGHEDIRVILWKDGPRKGDAADFEGDDDALRDLYTGAREWKADAVIPTGKRLRVQPPQKVDMRLSLDPDLRPPAPEIPMTSR